MLLLVPAGTGILVGLIVFFITKKLIDAKKARAIIYTPIIVPTVISIGLILYGYIFIRGFEGAAYLFLSITILVTLLLIFFYIRSRIN